MKRSIGFLLVSLLLIAGLAAAVQIASKGKVTASIGLNLREGPGTSYAVITTMPVGTIVEIVDQTMGWYKVNYQSYQGKYCSSRYIEITESKDLPNEDSAKHMIPTLNSTDPQRTPTNKIDPSTLP